MKRKSLWVLLGVAMVAVGVYYLWQQQPPPPQTTSAPLSPPQTEQPAAKPPTPTFPESAEPLASGGKPTLRWIGPGEGDWEDPNNWEDESDKSKRVPGPEDDVFIPQIIGTRTVRVLITDATPKRVRRLVNRGLIRGLVSEKNPAGSIYLEAAEIVNHRRIESADARQENEPSAVVIRAKRLRNEYVIEAGRSEVEGQVGGRVEIEVDILENKDEISAGDAWSSTGGSLTVKARIVQNMGKLRGGRGGQHAQSPPFAGGDILVMATEELNHYDGLIESGRSFAGAGGSVRLEASIIYHLGGWIRAGEGLKQEGTVTVVAAKILQMSGTKTSIRGHQIELRAPGIGINGLAVKSFQARAQADSIKITACQTLNLSSNKTKAIFEVPKEGAIYLSVPNERAIVLDKETKLDALGSVKPQIVPLSGPCP